MRLRCARCKFVWGHNYYPTISSEQLQRLYTAVCPICKSYLRDVGVEIRG
jgi:formate dehydrogenase maturation protein FdhE